MKKPKKHVKEYYDLTEVQCYLDYKDLDGERFFFIVTGDDGGNNGSYHSFNVSDSISEKPFYIKEKDHMFVKEVIALMGWQDELDINFELSW